ncbi:hypothetical protein EMIT0111MI5_280008 [Burkholderia sp. IT-111MI5]
MIIVATNGELQHVNMREIAERVISIFNEIRRFSTSNLLDYFLIIRKECNQYGLASIERCAARLTNTGKI